MELRFTHTLFYSIFSIFDIQLCYDYGLASLLLEAQQVVQSKQIRNLWRLTFVTTIWTIWSTLNNAIHIDITPTHHGCMIVILGLVRGVRTFKLGTMYGIDDLLIYRRLRVPAVPRVPRPTLMIR